MTFSTGWMEGVEHVPTGRIHNVAAVPDGTMWPKQIISHVMQGYQGTIIGWAQERPPVQDIAVHFSIGRKGRIVQHLSLWDPGRHVGWQDWNAHSIGIEHEGFSVNPGYGYDYVYNGEHPWPDALIGATIKVHLWVMEAIRTYDQTVHPDEQTIITHALTGQPDRQNDPGPLFMAQVRPKILAALNPTPAADPMAEYNRGWKDGRNTALDEVDAALGNILRG